MDMFHSISLVSDDSNGGGREYSDTVGTVLNRHNQRRSHSTENLSDAGVFNLPGRHNPKTMDFSSYEDEGNERFYSVSSSPLSTPGISGHPLVFSHATEISLNPRSRAFTGNVNRGRIHPKTRRKLGLKTFKSMTNVHLSANQRDCQFGFNNEPYGPLSLPLSEMNRSRSMDSILDVSFFQRGRANEESDYTEIDFEDDPDYEQLESPSHDLAVGGLAGHQDTSSKPRSPDNKEEPFYMLSDIGVPAVGILGQPFPPIQRRRGSLPIQRDRHSKVPLDSTDSDDEDYETLDVPEYLEVLECAGAKNQYSELEQRKSKTRRLVSGKRKGVRSMHQIDSDDDYEHLDVAGPSDLYIEILPYGDDETEDQEGVLAESRIQPGVLTPCVSSEMPDATSRRLENEGDYGLGESDNDYEQLDPTTVKDSTFQEEQYSGFSTDVYVKSGTSVGDSFHGLADDRDNDDDNDDDDEHDYVNVEDM